MSLVRGQRPEKQRYEEIGASYHDKCDADHPSPTLYRDRNQLTLLQGRDLDKMVADLALLRVDQAHLRGKLVPTLQQNEARLWTRIEQLEQDLINLRAHQVHK